MKLLLMADNYVGLEITQWLVSHYRDDIALVVSLSENGVYKVARDAGVACVIFHSAADVVEYCHHQCVEPDLGFLVWWPNLVKKPLLGLPRLGFINTHPSFLPYNRGKHYNFWALVEQVPFGVSLHFIDQGVDTGDIVAQKAVPYDWEDTGGSLYDKALQTMLVLVKEVYPKIRQFHIPRTQQDVRKGSFHVARELDSASHIDIDGIYRARDLLNLLRARTFLGFPACWFEENDEQFEVRVSIKRKVS